MKILIDTDIASYLMRNRSRRLWERLRSFGPGEVGLSAISAAELRYGMERTMSASNLETLDQFLAPLVVAPFDAHAARCYGEVRFALERKGTPIGTHDMLIAAHAISREVLLATNNIREFHRVAGLSVESWAR